MKMIDLLNVSIKDITIYNKLSSRLNHLDKIRREGIEIESEKLKNDFEYIMKYNMIQSLKRKIINNINEYKNESNRKM